MSTDSSERPIGQRFSHVYLRSANLLQDSERARRRIGALVNSLKDADGLSIYLTQELGVDPVWGMSSVLWSDTLRKFEPRDVFDFITLAFRFLTAKKRGAMHEPGANLRFLKSALVFLERKICPMISMPPAGSTSKSTQNLPRPLMLRLSL
jgi:hypothetical protein